MENHKQPHISQVWCFMMYCTDSLGSRIDPSHCHHWLCGLCPSLVFQNTRVPVPPCRYEHSEAARAQFQEAEAENRKRGIFDRWGYLRDLERLLDRLIRDCDSKIEQVRGAGPPRRIVCWFCTRSRAAVWRRLWNDSRRLLPR